ncbi:MAG: efflux transporter outer membrane subunit [Chlorobiaceae bacterium]|nr:efflux transporter outer membrane subunit [Chlorobiaceae bacterium]
MQRTVNKHMAMPSTSCLAAFLGVGLLSLSGCAAGPDFVRPDAPAVSAFDRPEIPSKHTSKEFAAPRFDEGVGPAANWWHSFGSGGIDSVVAAGLAGNPGLQAAQASLSQSRENLRAGAGIFFPQVGAAFNQSRGNLPSAAGGSSRQGSVFNLSTLSASVSYALDIFGGQRRAIEGLGAQVDQQQAETIGTYMMLSGNIVNTCIAIAAYREEIDEIEQLIAIQQQQLSIAETQHRSGIATFGAVLALQGQLTALEASLPPVRQQLSQSEHLLAALVGKTPAEWQAPDLRLSGISLPERLPLSLPSELVRQRPDILAAEARLHASNAAIGVATAAMFPSFTLNGTYERSGNSLSALPDGGNGFWGIGAGITQPLFNGGTLNAKRRAAIDARDQSQALYRQVVLGAFAQVADIVRALGHDAELADAQSRAVRDTKLSLDLVQANYRSGLVGYVQVILADIQYRQARIGLLQARARQLQDAAALYVALGGGWQQDAEAKKKAGLPVSHP